MTNVTPDSIFQVASGFMASKHLFVANEVGLFEGLAEGPKTLDELSARTGIPERTIRILADAMVALGFVERHDEKVVVADERDFPGVVPEEVRL